MAVVVSSLVGVEVFFLVPVVKVSREPSEEVE